MLQERVNELKSAILDIVGDQVHVTGFTREEMLQSHLDKGILNFSSKGLYNFQELEFHNIKGDALIIVKKDGVEINRYQYKPVFKDMVQFKDEEGKLAALTFTIIKSQYSDHYHFLTEKTSLLFDNKDELDDYLFEKFDVQYSY